MKIFDNDRLTEEGRHLCADADIRPEDIKVKTFDDFKAQVGHSEVAEIRFSHYQNKRLSKLYFYFDSHIFCNSGKLMTISKTIEQIAVQKRLDAEQADQAYLKKQAQQNQELGGNDHNQRPGTTGGLVGAFPSANFY